MNPYLSNAADPYKTKYEEALRENRELRETIAALRKEIAAVADEQDPAGAEILDDEGEPIDMSRVIRAAGSAAGSVVAVMDDGSNRIVPDAAAFWAAYEAM